MSQKHLFRFGLKSLLAAMSVVCIILAFIAQPIMEERSRQALLHELTARGAKVSFLADIPAENSFGRTLLSLFNSRYVRRHLYGLDFSNAALSDSDLPRIAKLRYIKQLNLNGLPITDASLLPIRSLPYLSELDLGGTKVTDQGIAGLDTLRNLCTLRVTGTNVSYAALEKLDATLPYAHFCEDRAIEELKVAGIQVVGSPRFMDGDPAQGMWVIKAGNQADHVIVGMNRKLTLVPDNVVHMNYLQSLREMTFHTITLGPGGLEQLKPIPKMKELEIWYVNLSDRDMEAIGRQTQLESLTICGCRQITNEGLKHLKSLKNLKRLHIEDCDPTTKEGMAALKRALPDCQCNYANYVELQRSLRESATSEGNQ